MNEKFKPVCRPLPFEEVEHFYLLSKESLNYVVTNWYDLRFGKLVIVKIHCWTDEHEKLEWELFWPGADAYRVEDTPKFETPESAAQWFYDHYIAEHT